MQRFKWFSGAMLLLLAAGVAFGQVSSEVAALKKQREELAKQIKAKQKQLAEARNAVYKSADLAPLQKAVTAAYKAVADKENADPEVKAAAKASQDAGKAAQTAIETAVAATAEGAALQKEIAAAKARIKEAETAILAAQKKMRDVRIKVEKDNAKVVEVRKAARSAFEAEKAVLAKKATAEKEALKKARAAFDAALEKKCAADPKASAARQAMDQLLKNDQELSKRIRALEHPPKHKPEVKKPAVKKT